MRLTLWTIALFPVISLGAPVGAKNADDPVEQTALAIPRIGMPGAHGVALPQPLSPSDVARTRHIFALQRAGAITEASREMDHLESDLLRGAILANRYLDTAYIADASELSSWLSRYGEQPDAPAIRGLLETQAQRPQGQYLQGQRPQGQQPGVKASSKVMAGVPVRSLLIQNNDLAAVATAQALLSRPQSTAADSLFSGGVAAWRLGDFAAAKPLFEAAWRAADTPSLRSATAFWSSRIAEKAHDRGARVLWLRRSAREPDTFYGPIARRALNPIVACLPAPAANKAVVTNADVEAFMAAPQGRRTFALLQVGEKERAEAELRSLWLDSGQRPALGRSMVLVAGAMGLTRFADDMRKDAAAAEAAIGKFDLPLLRPAGGFQMDPAFVYAVVRHESNFQPLAVSSVGARGLMQVMPATAVGIGAIGEGQTERLHHPATNLAIGQRYLIQLGSDPMVRDDLLKLIAAYGQGPTGMNRWAEGIRHNGDPFVFLEAIPSNFMRTFVIDVLIYHWQYAAALRLRASSLDDLAAGIYPRFTPIKAVPAGQKSRIDTCGPTPVKG